MIQNGHISSDTGKRQGKLKWTSENQQQEKLHSLVNAGNFFKLFFTALYWHNALQYGSALF